MAEWLSEDIVRAADGKVYQKVGENSFKLYDAPPPNPNAVMQKDDNPSLGDVAKGLGAEVGIATAGQVAAYASGPILYPFIAFGSGFLASHTAQQIEGREDFSLGRALTAGVINLIPFSSAAKGVDATTKITKEVVGAAAKIEAKRGAAIGVGEATAVAIIDHERLPTVEELATYGGLGSLFGGSVGAVTPKFSKAFSKFLGKTPDQIDADINRGNISETDLVELGLVRDVTQARRILNEAGEAIENKQIVKTMEEAYSGGVSNWERFKGMFKPSAVTGREVQDISFYSSNELRATQEIASKVARSVDKHLKKDPSLVGEVNNFLDTGVISPRVKGTALAGDLVKFRQELNKMQALLIDQLDTHKFSNLSAERQKSLLQTIKDSVDSEDMKYTSTRYELFDNAKFKIDPKKKQAAIDEIAVGIQNDSPKMSMEAAQKKAQDHINRLIKNSAKNRMLRQDRGMAGTVDASLKARTNPGKAEREFLGEITDPAERMRGTLDIVGSSVYRNKGDIEIAKSLQKSGLAITNPPDDSAFVPLTLKGALETDLYVPNTVQFALNKTYLQHADRVGGDVIKEGAIDLFDAGIGLSKAVKVLLNPPSYFVNYLGGVVTMLGTGMNPFSRSYMKGMKFALSEFGNVEDIMSGATEAGRKGLMDAIQDMKKYGISNANVLASDIRANFKGGIFTDGLQKKLEPIGKAYQATDTAARYSVWATNQERLSKMFPDLQGDALKLAAAKLTNDTFQNYDKLNHAIRLGSKYGVLPQFVSFTAEFMRNVYNQTRYATQMVRGTFGKDFGLDMSRANMKSMRIEGMKRLTALSTVIGGTEAARQAYNASQGITAEQEEALKGTVVADFDKTKSLLFTVGDNPNEVSYVNLSYISPHAMVAEAFNAAISDTPITNLVEYMKDNWVGEGSFVANSLMDAVRNTDPYGRPISLEVDHLNRFKDQLGYFVSDAFKPGISREAEKVIDTAYSEDPKYSFNEIAARQVGYRMNKLEVDNNSVFKIRDASVTSQQAVSKYRNLVRFGTPTEAQARESFMEASRLHQANMTRVLEHNNNLVALGVSQEDRIKIMKDAGVSSKDILAALDNKIVPLSPDVNVTPREEFEELSQGRTRGEVSQEISRITKEDRDRGIKLRSQFRDSVRDERLNISERDKLFRNMGVEDRVNFIISNPDMYHELLRKRIITKSVTRELQKRGFRPPRRQ